MFGLSHRLSGIGTVAALLLGASAGRAEAVLDSSPQPNIVLCMADDQGWGDVGYYGEITVDIYPTLLDIVGVEIANTDTTTGTLI